jgi:hypothetical protein
VRDRFFDKTSRRLVLTARQGLSKGLPLSA